MLDGLDIGKVLPLSVDILAFDIFSSLIGRGPLFDLPTCREVDTYFVSFAAQKASLCFMICFLASLDFLMKGQNSSTSSLL